ncbi:MAG TPA: DUF6677 family protein [Terriglobales bacterium]|jgi:hypothetical protein|nr:DUF6677 family protein [Terriglobales bacterium]
MVSKIDMESATGQPAQQVYPVTTFGIVAPVVAWLFPGAGHLIQGRWGRGLLIMLSVYSMFGLGLLLEGKLYSFNTGDLLDMLGFVGDMGAGALYVFGRVMNYGAGNISHATADYGTKYLIVSGLLNIISAVDAHHIAIGKKR